MVKRLFSLMIVIVLSFVFASVSCESNYGKLFSYRINTDGNASITGINWEYVFDDVVVPSEIDGLMVAGIDEYAFISGSGESKAVNIILPETLTRIEDFAFSYSDITSITIPRSVTEIGVGVSSGCKHLQSINVDPGNEKYASIDGALYYKPEKTLIAYVQDAVVPNGIVNIGDYACEGLTVQINNILVESIRHIGRGAFEHSSVCITSLKRTGDSHIRDHGFAEYYCYIGYLMNDGLESIDDMAFQDAYIYTSLTSASDVELKLYPDSVQTIGTCAFNSCHLNLGAGKDQYTTIILGEGVTTMNYGTFCYFSLTQGEGELRIPNHLDYLDEGALQCVGLVITTENKQSVWIDELGYEAIASSTFNIPITIGRISECSCMSSTIPMITLLDGITEIPGSVFCSARIDQINIPNTLLSIDGSAFEETTGLTTIDFSHTSITSIPDYAFHASSVSRIILPATVTQIGDRAFAESAVEYVSLPEGLQTIGSGSFLSCMKLTNLVVPSTVTSIAEDAFERNVIQLEVDASSYAEQWARSNGIPFVYKGGADLSWLGTEAATEETQDSDISAYNPPDFWNEPDRFMLWLRDSSMDEITAYFEYCESNDVYFGNLMEYIFNYLRGNAETIGKTYGMHPFLVKENSYMMFWDDNRSVSVLICGYPETAKKMADDPYDRDSVSYACGNTLVSISDFAND